jgi:hypothetical protein
MSMQTQPPETDLIVPLPEEGETWDPWTIHTHYFGASVPEAELGIFTYIRYMPAFASCQGGVCIFRGLDNFEPVDMEFCDYKITMPWPKVDGNVIETENGLRFEFIEPGKKARVTYESADGKTSLDLEQDAVSPLLMRGHVVPGEETQTDPSQTPGGSEQFMHATGKLTVRGESLDVDCFAPRDRSWRQVRSEAQGGAAPIPAVGWSPMCFGEDLIFNQISFEPLDTDPAWAGHYDHIPADKPTHHFAWLYTGGDLREITRVRRNVLEYHPRLHMSQRQEVEAEDADGNTYTFRGEAIAMAGMPAWPNAGFRDSVYRWESEDGRVTHATYQELWADHYQRVMNERARATAGA